MEDLARLYDFLAQSNPRAAVRAVTTLRNAVRQLLAHPRLGSLLRGFEPREVRRLLVSDYEMRYEVAGTAVHILPFFHTREDR